MIHLGTQHDQSKIISKGIAAGKSRHTYRGMVSAHRKATSARNFTNCDSLLIGDQCGAHTVPYIEAEDRDRRCSSTRPPPRRSREDQLFYCQQRGLSEEEAVALIVNGFVKEVLQQLPMEFAVESAEADHHFASKARVGLTPDASSEHAGPKPGHDAGTQRVDGPGLRRPSHCRMDTQNNARNPQSGRQDRTTRTSRSSMACNLTVNGRARSPPSWGRTAPGKSTLSYVIAGKEDYEVLDGEILLDGENVLEMEAVPERAAAGTLPRLPVSAGDPRRRHDDLPEGGDERAAQGARRGRAADAGLHQAASTPPPTSSASPQDMLRRAAQCRLLGR